MADDQRNAVGDELAGGDHRLLGIADVVGHDDLYLLAEHAARRIDVSHRHLRATLYLRACPGELSGERASDPDQHLRVRGQAERGRKHNCYGNEMTHGSCAG